MSTPTFPLTDQYTSGGDDQQQQQQVLAPPAPPAGPTGIKGYFAGVLQKLPKALAMVESSYGNPAPLQAIEQEERSQEAQRQQEFSNTVTAQRENRANQMYKVQMDNFQSEMKYRDFQMKEAQRKGFEDQLLQHAHLIAAGITDPNAPSIPGIPKMSPEQARAYLDAVRDKVTPQHYVTDAQGHLQAVDERTNIASPVTQTVPNPAAAQTAPGLPLAHAFAPPTLKLPVSVKDPFDSMMGKPQAGITALVGLMPRPEQFPAGMNDPAFHDALNKWGKAYTDEQVRQQTVAGAGRAAAFGMNRPLSMYDPTSGTDVYGTLARGPIAGPNGTPIIAGTQAGAFGIAGRGAAVGELDKAMEQVRQAVSAPNALVNNNTLAAALNPSSTELMGIPVGQMVQGKLLNRLTPPEQNVINTIRNLRQSVLSLRSIVATASGGSDKRVEILESELPNVQDLSSGDPQRILQRLATFNAIYQEIKNSYPQLVTGATQRQEPQPPNRPPKGAKVVELKDFLGNQ